MYWKEILLFCVVFHAIEYVVRIVDRYLRERSWKQTLENLVVSNQRIDSKLERVK